MGGVDCTLWIVHAIPLYAITLSGATATLLYKRRIFKDKRPTIVFAMDVAKFFAAAITIHIVSEIAISNSINSAAGTTPQPISYRSRVGDQCSWRFAIGVMDGSLLVALMAATLSAWGYFVAARNITTQHHGRYGHPPKWDIWLQQFTVYTLFLFAVKGLCLYIFHHNAAFLNRLGTAILVHLNAFPRLQSFLILAGVPLLSATIQLWTMDHLLKCNDHDALNSNDRRAFYKSIDSLCKSTSDAIRRTLSGRPLASKAEDPSYDAIRSSAVATDSYEGGSSDGGSSLRLLLHEEEDIESSYGNNHD